MLGVVGRDLIELVVDLVQLRLIGGTLGLFQIQLLHVLGGLLCFGRDRRDPILHCCGLILQAIDPLAHLFDDFGFIA